MKKLKHEKSPNNNNTYISEMSSTHREHRIKTFDVNLFYRISLIQLEFL